MIYAKIAYELILQRKFTESIIINIKHKKKQQHRKQKRWAITKWWTSLYAHMLKNIIRHQPSYICRIPMCSRTHTHKPAQRNPLCGGGGCQVTIRTVVGCVFRVARSQHAKDIICNSNKMINSSSLFDSSYINSVTVKSRLICLLFFISFRHGFSMFFNLFSSWIFLKYFSLAVKQ